MKNNETPSFVSRTCSYTNLRRISKHDAIKHKLTTFLRQRSFECRHEEVYCIGQDEVESTADNITTARNWFLNILAFESNFDKAYIIDFTFRFESNREIDREVQAEKARIHQKTGHTFTFEVIGLWFRDHWQQCNLLLWQFSVTKDATIRDDRKHYHHQLLSINPTNSQIYTHSNKQVNITLVKTNNYTTPQQKIHI